MSRHRLIEPVFTGPRSTLQQARKALAAIHIDSRATTPTRTDGVLKVAREEASSARAHLTRWNAQGKGRIISAQEAAFYFCPACQAVLSDGALRCPVCGEFVGDPHGL
ncbi:MAG: zinc ribbon domain-containing protein [Deltaproteobacteria bacterium]|nr:zinc ribbon domain-containing protein [Deltaproteobacteria bacterium]